MPAAALITEPFVQTASLYCQLNGVPDYRYVVVSHPISSLDAEGYQKLVDQALPKVLEILTRGS